MAGRKFEKYEKITESASDWTIKKSKLNGVQWVVTEKVHGANMCLHCSPAGVAFCKRTGFLEPGDPFFGYRSFLPAKCEAKALHLYQALLAEQPTITTVWIFGELFGGGYPHPDVPQSAIPVQLVQSGIYYSPELEFYSYDIGIQTVEHPQREYLPYTKCIDLFRANGFLYAEPLLIGTYDQALAFPVGFDSHVPARLGLPTLPPGTNKAEGIVIKPVTALWMEDAKGERRRVILKKKIPQFAEKQYDDNGYVPPAVTPPAGKDAAALRGEIQALQYELGARVTRQRLINVLSKEGHIADIFARGEALRLLNLFCDDARADLLEDPAMAAMWGRVGPEGQAACEAGLREQTKAAMDAYYAPLLKGRRKPAQAQAQAQQEQPPEPGDA
ncbi:putative RNA ligase [Paratrimastix pyriformis]|uniref:RNA ligase n=1 Tax=Paratrimastix pyriformis TaxID=342808 RepID=A0ABQ8UKN3_9EUKA|nr:putative RNA ligase [Paratrimastix pyriformis]